MVRIDGKNNIEDNQFYLSGHVHDQYCKMTNYFIFLKMLVKKIEKKQERKKISNFIEDLNTVIF